MEKSKKPIVLVLFVIGVVIIFYFGLQKESPDSKHFEQIEEQPIVEKEVVDEEIQAQSEQEAEKPEGLEQFSEEEIKNLEYSHKAAQAANQNIIFYGKCVDQDGNPIEGVKVDVKITKMRKSMVMAVLKESFKYYETETTMTDSNGRFEFKDRGSYLLFENISHPEYLNARSSSSNRGYQFGQILYGNALAGMHQPDPLKPVIFTLWKKGQGSKTEVKESRVKIKKEELNSTQYFDLKTSKKTNQSDPEAIEISGTNGADLKWDADQKKYIGSSQNYEWSYTISLPNGGFAKTSDLFLFRPPESGYEESYTVQFKGNEEDWTSTPPVKKLYFKTGKGNYGAIEVQGRSYSDGRLLIKFNKILFNPTGERTLEYWGK
tara:strand:- start:82 stop:1209 length:1128 start_codon:yes stop_codon:yes gene_type:complete